MERDKEMINCVVCHEEIPSSQADDHLVEEINNAADGFALYGMYKAGMMGYRFSMEEEDE